MFHAHFVVFDDVMQKHIVIDAKTFANEFNMDTSSAKLTIGSHANCNKEKFIAMLFPFSTLRDVDGKLLITSLSLKDRIICFALCKVIILRITNFTQIMED